MPEKNNVVTTKYNVVLFSIFVLFQTVVSFFEYKEEPATMMDRLFSYDALIGFVVLGVLFILSAIACIWVLRSFWQRLVVSMFGVRPLTINEAISILLVIAILTVS